MQNLISGNLRLRRYEFCIKVMNFDGWLDSSICTRMRVADENAKTEAAALLII